MKAKFTAATLALFTLVATLLLPASTASADIRLLEVVKGDQVSEDVGCSGTVEPQKSGFLPPGLTLNSLGTVSGSPFAEGSYTLNDVKCIETGADFPISYFFDVTIRVLATDPTNFISVERLNDINCSYQQKFLHTLPSAALLTMKITNQSGTELLVQESTVAPSYMTNQIVSLEQLNNKLGNPGNTLNGEPFACGDTLFFGFAFGVDGGALQVVNVRGVKITAPSRTPYIVQVPGQECTVRASLPISSVGPTTTLNFFRTNAPEDIQISFVEGTVTNGLIIIEFALKDFASYESTHPVGSVQSNVLECGTTWEVALSEPNLPAQIPVRFTLAQTMPICDAGQVSNPLAFGCDPTPKGSYTRSMNSTVATSCPSGMTTLGLGSTSINDCYKPIAQAIAGFKAPKAMKFKATSNLALTTNTKALATFKVTGPCTAKVSNIATKVKGKKVTTKMLKVTAGNKAGSCSVTLTSAAKDKYLAMSKLVKIKVSKSGK